MNTRLKVAIIEAHTTQRDLSRRLDMDETRLSRIVHEEAPPTADERKRIARALKKKISDLWTEEPVSA